MFDLFGRMDTAASGLSAHRTWMDLIAGNIANAQTTNTPEGGPFKRQLAHFMERAGADGRSNGVILSAVTSDDSEPRKVYQPEHPDAGPDGYVSFPNIDTVVEMVDLIAASRAYEANATVIEAAKSGFQRSISLLQI